MDVLWKKCLKLIEEKVLPEDFSTCFSSTYPHSQDGDFLNITVPDECSRKRLAEDYLSLIEASLESVSKNKVRVNFLVNPGFFREKAALPGNSPKGPSIEIKEAWRQEKSANSTSLSSKYSFSNFVVGSSNQFAQAMAKAVASNPGKAYNPFFLYGATGLGKTHLLHAIGNEILQENKDANIRYTSSEGFTIDLIQSIKKDNMSAFRERYRPLDVLLIDDIQFIAGKERTQEEFFHTFNTLCENYKQVVISSDTSPKEMQKMEERLRSRFECGLIADIEPPDLETKVAIIYKKSERYSLKIPQDVAMFIAKNTRSNIRELEGLLLKLIVYSSFTHRTICMELAQEVLKDFSDYQTQSFTIPNILKIVCSHFNIKISEIKSKKRSRYISIPRQIAMFICREYTKASLPEIGRQFGGKDHTTVIFSYKKISKQLKENNEIAKSVQKIIQKIENT